MMCFVLFVHVMTRWDPTAQLDRDDPFEMVLKTCHHLRAEGMSWSTLMRAAKENTRCASTTLFTAKGKFRRGLSTADQCMYQ